MNTRKWIVQEVDEKKCAVLQKELGILPVTAKLLCIREIDTPEKARTFFDKENIKLHDPFLLKDIDIAVNRIKQAIAEKQRVCIYGDYDVDGVTATTLLYTYLSEKGVDCSYFIPERISEGYGLSVPVIERMAGKVDLIITVDTGITAIAEAKLAKELGIDMIITDHHSCRMQLPEAVAVVNPHREDSEYPFKQLAGVGVVFKLLCALEGDSESICEKYAEIVAIGTIADVMPLVDENRYIATVGLKKLSDTAYPGLRALMEQSGIIKNGKNKKILSTTVGFVLAPRINAAGRIASASKAVELLITKDEKEAAVIANELCEINKQRQTTEQKIYEQALEMINPIKEKEKFFVLKSEGWHQGVIGVVASKIAEKYSLPCILFSVSDGIGKGSGRSVKGFSLMDALSDSNDLLVEFGGHELAAGLSIEEKNISEFRKRLNIFSEQNLPPKDSIHTVDVDCEVQFDEINIKSIEEILSLEPFGLQNQVPVLIMKNVVISEVIPLAGGKHIRIKIKPLDCLSGELNAVYFGMSNTNFRFFPGDICDIAFSVDINEYMGVSSPQLLLKAVKHSETEKEKNENSDRFYRKINDNNNHDSIPDWVVPNVHDFRAAFRFLKKELSLGNNRLSAFSVCKQISIKENLDFNTCKIRIILDVLSDERIISYNYIGKSDVFEFDFLPVSKKINIDESRRLLQIRKKHYIYSEKEE